MDTLQTDHITNVETTQYTADLTRSTSISEKELNAPEMCSRKSKRKQNWGQQVSNDIQTNNKTMGAKRVCLDKKISVKCAQEWRMKLQTLIKGKRMLENKVSEIYDKHTLVLS